MRPSRFAHAGEALLATPGGGSDVRAEARVCVHAGNDGTCGTSGSSPGPAPAAGGVASFVQRYSGPYALVAGAASVTEGHTYRRGHAPRILSGTILAAQPRHVREPRAAARAARPLLGL